MVRSILEALKLGVQADVTCAVKNPETGICTKCREYVARRKGGLCVARTIMWGAFEAHAVEAASPVLN